MGRMTTAIKNYRIGLLALTLAVMAAVAVPGLVQGQVTPGAPRNLAITVGDTEAKISWEAPDAGACAVTEYYVSVWQLAPRKKIRESKMMTATQWTLDGLIPNTSYRADVVSYGESCDEYSDTDAKKDFITNTNSSSSDPSRGASEAKYIPDPPSNLVITAGDTEAKISWSAPASDAATCTATKYYVKVWQLAPRKKIRESDMMTVTQWTLDGLTPNTNYRAAVISYSESCDEESNSAKKDFTTNTSSSSSDPSRGASEAKYIPVSPSGVAIARQSTNSIRVSWTPAMSRANTCAHSEYSVSLDKDGTRVAEVDGITDTHRDFEGAYTAGARYTAKVESYSGECDEWSDRARLSTTVP